MNRLERVMLLVAGSGEYSAPVCHECKRMISKLKTKRILFHKIFTQVPGPDNL